MIEDLDLSVRAFTILRLLKVTTVEQFKSFDIEQHKGQLLGRDYFFSQGVNVSSKVIDEINQMQNNLNG